MRQFLFSITLATVFLTSALSQVEEPTEEVKKYAISDINANEENSIATISSCKKELKRINEGIQVDITVELDSLYTLIEPYTDEFIQSLSIQSLKNTNSAIESISKSVKSIQSKYTSDVEKVQNLDKLIDIELSYWNEVKDHLSESKDITTTLKERIRTLIKNLEDTKKDISNVRNIALDNSSELSAYNTELEIIKEFIADQDEQLRNSYLIRDSEPLWRISEIEKDTTLQKTRSSKIISENTEALNLYIKFNGGMLITHLIVIILLYLLFRFSQKLTSSILSVQSSKHLATFSKNPLTTAYVFSFLLISFIGTGYPVILLELYLITLFIPIYRLIKTYIKPENRIYIIIFLALFTIQLFVNHISFVYISGRIFLLILELIIFGYFIFIVLKSKNFGNGNNYTLFRNSLLVSALLFLGSAIANVVGIVKLSLLLSVSAINCIGIGVLIFLFYQISWALFIVLAEVKPFSELNIVKEHKEELIKRIKNLVRIFLIFLFIRAVLKQFKLYKGFTEWWQNFVNESWEVGEVAITIGDFINFFIIITITILVSRFLKYFLRTELLPRFIKTRGLPNAISTSVYYIILVIGFFIAAFSTGIEWSKINLAIGALGVGIGFGLQTLVYNFIAGLILTYERPVQVGDIIQLNTLMGSIKEIGVRSSRVQTYDGAEVVVPNGNLISNEVINWTLTNNHKRQELKFKASTNANPNEIVELLKEVPLNNPKVIAEPNPLALFEGYGDDGTLDFRLLFWTHVDVGLSSKSEVALAIYEELQKRGYELPVQRSSVRIEGDTLKKI